MSPVEGYTGLLRPGGVDIIFFVANNPLDHIRQVEVIEPAGIIT